MACPPAKQGGFQIVDVVDMMQPITKYTRQIESGDLIPSTVREAFRQAQEERPGAAHLELDEDIAREETQEPVIEASYVRRPIAERKAFRRAVELISQARHPLLLIGAAANRKLTCKMLRWLIDQTGIPFVTTQMGKGVINEDDDKFLGNVALSSGDFVHRVIDAADVIINVGHDAVEKPPFIMKPGGRTVIRVNFTGAEVDPVYFPQVEVVGDIANSIRRFTEKLHKQESWNFSYFMTVREHLERHIADRSDDGRFRCCRNASSRTSVKSCWTTASLRWTSSRTRRVTARPGIACKGSANSCRWCSPVSINSACM